VIIPVFNAEKYLVEAIKSVITQGVDNIEILIIDDASTDQSMEVATSFFSKVCVHKLKVNSGPGIARNLGIKKARGEWVAFLDADDLWIKGKLKDQLNYLTNHPETDMVFGNVEQFVSPELPDKHKIRLRDELKIMPGYVAGTMLIRKETFLSAGWFDGKLELGEFIDWFSRAKDIGLKYHVLDDVVLKRRIHANNLGIKKNQHLKDYTAILRAAIARKRIEK